MVRALTPSPHPGEPPRLLASDIKLLLIGTKEKTLDLSNPKAFYGA